MALTSTCLRFLLWAKKTQAVSFEDCLTLGHLQNQVARSTAASLANRHPGYLDAAMINWEDPFADSVFSSLGANTVKSLDTSNYEKADIIHDLNIPLDEKYSEAFSAIIDGGTLEHVFNIPVAIQNCMNALKTGGHFIGFSPANNLLGHGFYQFSPELMFRIFTRENGFRIKGVFLVAAPFSVDTNTWYEVIDPKSAGERVTLANTFPTYMMVLAEKISGSARLQPIFQSDYISAWNNNAVNDNNSGPRRYSLLNRVIDKVFRGNKNEEDLEKINPAYFRKKVFE